VRARERGQARGARARRGGRRGGAGARRGAARHLGRGGGQRRRPARARAAALRGPLPGAARAGRAGHAQPRRAVLAGSHPAQVRERRDDRGAGQLDPAGQPVRGDRHPRRRRRDRGQRDRRVEPAGQRRAAPGAHPVQPVRGHGARRRRPDANAQLHGPGVMAGGGNSDPMPGSNRRGRAAARLRAVAAAGLATLALAAGLVASAQPGVPSAGDAAGDRTSVTPEGLVNLDFQDVEIATVIDTIARLTGRNFVYDDRIRGRVTIISPTPIPVEQAYTVFESVLQVKGFTTVEAPGGVVKVIPIRDAKETSVDTRAMLGAPDSDRFVTRLIPLRYIDAEAISNTLKPLV